MSTDSDKYDDPMERESRHSALEELKRDERRPAVILLGALLLSAIFFAFGIMVGRWTTQTSSQPTARTVAPSLPPVSTAAPPPQPQSSNNQKAASSPSPPTRPPEPGRRFNLVIENLSSDAAAQALVKSLERMGYKDVRTSPRTAAPRSQFSVLIGHYTREEAEAEATKLRGRGGPRLKDVRVMEEADDEHP
jgi:cytoskeletal protein RodZ